MKVLLYFENEKALKKSGIGRALRHEIKACESNSIEYSLSTSLKDIDLVHINTYFMSSYRLAKKAKKKGIPLIVHGHSTKEDFLNSFRFYNLIKYYYYNQLKKMYKIADLIITPTTYSKELILSYNYNKNVVSLSNGISLDEYKYDETSVNLFLEKFNIKKEDNIKVIMGVGLPFKRKGIQDFFEVARHYENDKTKIFIWFGHLNWLLRSSYINKVLRHKPSNVILPGYIDGKIIKGAYLYSSIVFFPTYEETEGIVSLEALASKTPLLTRNIGVYKNFLEDNKSCYMGNNNSQFIAKIDYILSHDNLDIIEEGYRVAKERDINLIGKKLKNIYENLINSKK